MNFLYICRDGDNEELRYSIRSVVASFPDAEIWVVGGKPDWYKGNYIEVPQSSTKYENVKRNQEAAYSSEKIPEDIILMNDDFFIIKKIDDIKIYHNGMLSSTVRTFKRAGVISGYVKKLNNTFRHLSRRLSSSMIYDYELHVPMPAKKSQMLDALGLGLATRSVYGNLNFIGGEQMSDVKYYLGGRMQHKNYDIDNLEYPYLSSNDDSFEILHKTILKDMFPKPSRFEKRSRKKSSGADGT